MLRADALTNSMPRHNGDHGSDVPDGTERIDSGLVRGTSTQGDGETGEGEVPGVQKPMLLSSEECSMS